MAISGCCRKESEQKMITILILAALAGIIYLVYRNLPTKQEIYDDEQKEKNLLADIESNFKKDI